LLAACAGQRRLVASLAVAAFLSGLIGLLVPVFTMVVFDRVIPHAAFETLWALILGVSLLLAVDLALRHVRHALGDAMSMRAACDLGSRFYSRLLHAPLADAPRNAGALVQPYQEMRQAAHAAPAFVAGLLVDLPFFLVTVAFMASLGGWIAVIPVLGAAAILALHGLTHVAARPHAALEARLADRQNHAIVEASAAKETVQVTGAGPGFLSRWEERTDAGALAGHKARGLANIAAHGGATVAQLVTVSTVGAGAYAVAASDMTLGALSACMMLASRAIAPVAALMAQGFRLAQTARHSGALGELLAASPERGGDSERPVGGVTAAFSLNGVGFRYAADGRAVLDGVTLRIAPGERIAIIGKSGCGKSTLLRLLARLHAPTSGTIHVDGRHIGQVDPLTLRRDIALMPQEPALLDASLAANMSVGLPPIDPDWFQHVAEIAGVADYASAHPAGFSMPVGVGGSALSGGERQAAALARAIMGKPALLLLDEPTAAMDNECETRVVQMLRKELNEGALAGAGLIIATHRLPILQLVDRIVWLDKGRVIADGTREDVFRKVGVAA
jgi:ATP-binding cassette subfamily C protein LapB